MTMPPGVTERNQLDCLRAFLVSLPKWRDESWRKGFVEFALFGSPVLNNLVLAGPPDEIAFGLALQLVKFSSASEPGAPHPACALFASARNEQFDANRVVAQLIRECSQAFGCEPVRPAGSCPYPGLIAFDWERDPERAGLYFGREPETEELIGRLRDEGPVHFHLVTGASGSGKSSLVKAGLWRQLGDPRAGEEPIPGCRGWLVSAMVPNIDGDAFLTMIGSLRGKCAPQLGLIKARELAAEAQGGGLRVFRELLDRILDKHPRWLLILDQMEELFAPEAEVYREPFARFLVEAVREPRFSVVATLRCDFLHRLVEHPLLRTLMQEGSQTYLGTPGHESLRRMIALPAEQAGLDLEPRLVERLIEDAGTESGGLALLAAVLQDLCENLAEDCHLTLAHYEEGIGGLEGVLIRRGERGLSLLEREGLDRSQAEGLLRRVFGKLVNVASYGERTTRRRVSLSRWPANGAEQRMIQIFCRDAYDPRDAVRLLVCGESQNTPTIEIAHEALFDKWPPLSSWIEVQREALVRRNQVIRDSAAWEHGGRKDPHLPKPDLIEDVRERLVRADLWDDLRSDLANARYLARDDVEELLDLLVREFEEARRTHRIWRGALETACHLGLVIRRWETARRLAERLIREQPDIARWLRRGAIGVFRLLRYSTEPEWQSRRIGIGDLLAVLGDHRAGVGLRPDGLPDFAWCEIPAGDILWQDRERRSVGAFRIARYPVTNAQYQVFVDAQDYGDSAWWHRLPASKPPRPSRWPQPNRPRTHVNWAESMAFCRWLTVRLRERGTIAVDERIRLPTEYEWERAVRGSRGRTYPWGNRLISGYANINETTYEHGGLVLGQTSAVGFYPLSDSMHGLKDCTGNVWEWCLNKYEDPEDLDPSSDATRPLRGGSWNHDRDYAKTKTRRHDFAPWQRYRSVGLRVVLVPDDQGGC